MELSRLISALYGDSTSRIVAVPAVAEGGLTVTGIFYSSRDVKPGGLFVAIRGTRADGHDHVKDAVGRGAAVIVAERPVDAGGAIVIEVRDSRRALARLAATFYGDPSGRLVIVSVTGTNGKSTVTYFVESVLVSAGFKTGVIGTVNIRYEGKVFPNPMTTPDAADLQKVFADMLEAGVTHVVMEVSSHALVQGRLLFTAVDVSVFTNLSQDHLDYHRNMEDYFAAKALLFTDYAAENGPKQMMAVINTDDPYGKRLAAATRLPLFSTGLSGEATVRGRETAIDASGIRGVLGTPAGDIPVNSPLVGLHNFRNILSAAGAGLALGLSPAVIARGLSALSRVPGRLERVENPYGRHTFVDYAHTPDALEKILESMNKIKTGRIITVMGCGGDRDRGKRPIMGEISARLSDLLVISSDNPRTEDPLSIIAEILPGAARVKKELNPKGPLESGFVVEPDRARAIALAVAASRPGDTIIVAGKGHEDYQIIGTEKRRFDDRQEAARALALLAGKD